MFNGTNAWVTVNDAASLRLTTGMTLSAWVYPTSVNGYETVLLKERGTTGLTYALYSADDTGRPPAGYVYRNGDQSVVGPSTLPLNAWSHLAVTYNASALRLFVNGVQVATRNQTGAMPTTAGPLRIGGNSVWGEYYNGLIDEVRVYNNALTQGEVQTDMNTPVVGTPDTTAPTVAVTAPANGATVAGASVSVTANAADNVGVVGVQFYLDGNPLGAEDLTAPYAVNWSTTTVPDGSHTLTARARDAAGNQSTSVAVNVTVGNADLSPPTVALTAPTDGATVTGSVTVSANASDDVGVAGVQFYLDGSPLGAEDVTGPYSITWNSSTAVGARLLTAVARDAAGNTTTSALVSVTVTDSAAPTVALTAPATNATVSGAVAVTATATDNVGGVGVQFYLNGSPLGADDTTAPYEITWDTTTATNGTHQLTAVARDAAGNTATTAVRTVTVANPDYSFTVLNPVISTGLTGSTYYEIEVVYLNGFVTPSVDLWYEGVPAGVVADFALDPMSHQGRTELFIDTVGATPGTYTFTVAATANGITHSRQVTLVVTDNSDFGVLASPSVQTVTAGNAITFAVTLSEINDFVNPVTLSVPNMPAGMTASFAIPALIPAASTTLTLATTGAVTPGTYTLNVTGTAGALVRSVPVTVTVTSSNAVWTVRTLGSTGVPNNTVRLGTLKGDGVERVYVGTISTGRVLEYTWNGSGWSGPVDVGGSPTGHEIHDMTIGAGRGDGQDRIYAASYDNRIYEIWYDGTAWRQQVVGTLNNLAMHAAVGVGRNDGVTRLYTASTQTLYEHTWNGTSWSQVTIGSTPGAHNVSVGVARGDGVNRVYVASISSGTFEASFNGSTWTIASMGDTGDARAVSLGAGRNDGVVRVYSALLDGRMREFTWTGTAWSIAHTQTVPGAQHIHAYIIPGRNDGVLRVYSSSADGKAYEFTWTGSGWAVVNMGGGSDYLYGLHYGNGRNDGVLRLYGADRGAVNRVYEYTWTTPDAVPPTVAVTSPSGGATVSGVVSVAATAGDNVGVVGVQFLLNGQPIGAEVTTAPYVLNWNSGTVANGVHQITARARDAAGNQTVSAAVSVTVNNVDASPPTVAITAPANGATVSGVVSVSADAADDVGVVGVRFYLNGSPLGAEDTTTPYSISWNTAGTPNGTYTLTAVARDAAGNSTTSAVVTVTVSNTAATGLVAAWGFEETGGTATDVSGNGHTGTVNGPARVAGRYGQGLSFDGVNDLMTVADSALLDLTTGMTLSAWVRPTTTSGWRTVLLKEAPGTLAYSLYSSGDGVRPSGYVRVGGNDSAAIGPTALSTTAWSYLAVTYDGVTIRLYLNGTQVATQARTGAITTSANPLQIGGNNVWSEWFSGLIDEVRVYNRALTVAEITTDMNTPVGGGQPLRPAAPAAPTELGRAAAVSPADLRAAADAAKRRWLAAGITPAQAELLSRVQFVVTDLNLRGHLGEALVGTPYVLIDDDAAGFGWYTDPTPDDDAEFPLFVAPGERAATGGPADGRYDLLTVLTHELGHILGLVDLHPSVAPHDLMTDNLPTGTRRLPTVAEVGVVVAWGFTPSGGPTLVSPTESKPTAHRSPWVIPTIPIFVSERPQLTVNAGPWIDTRKSWDLALGQILDWPSEEGFLGAWVG